MKRGPAGLATLLGLLAAAGPAPAHHSFAAEFDGEKAVKVTGTVTKFDWVNPHAWIYLDVREPDGKLVKWAFEFGAPTLLYRQGWRRSDLKEGDEVTVEGYRARDGTNTASAATVTLSTGRRLFAGTSRGNDKQK
jgi:hypothetical protein